MALVRVRKELAGSDSFGHVWPEDGSEVEMEYEQALVLVAIPDAGCSVAGPALDPEPAEEEQPAEGTEPGGPETPDEAPNEPEPAPTPDKAANAAQKPRRTRAQPKRAAPTAEE